MRLCYVPFSLPGLFPIEPYLELGQLPSFEIVDKMKGVAKISFGYTFQWCEKSQRNPHTSEASFDLNYLSRELCYGRDINSNGSIERDLFDLGFHIFMCYVLGAEGGYYSPSPLKPDIFHVFRPFGKV